MLDLKKKNTPIYRNWNRIKKKIFFFKKKYEMYKTLVKCSSYSSSSSSIHEPSSHQRLSLYKCEGKSFGLHPDITNMLTICKNPLLRHTQTCAIFWDEIEEFNKKMNSMQYSIAHLHVNIHDSHFEEMDEFCKDHEDAAECLVYDV